jgi:hypothetical protein
VKPLPYVNEINNIVNQIVVSSPAMSGNCLYFDYNNSYVNSCEGFLYPMDKWKLPFYFYNPKTKE